ncbi:MAG: RusA family crossover junction endodeoxyribonuclease [Bacillota bacterium]
MSERIRIVVPGRPVPAARMTRRGKWVSFNAQRYLAYKAEVASFARQAVRVPLQGRLGVEIWAYCAGGRVGDVDNLAKAILDGLNGVVWYDDNQVVDLVVHRRYGKPQRAEIEIWVAEDRSRGEETA